VARFAEIIRARSPVPTARWCHFAQYNELFTMHGIGHDLPFRRSIRFRGLANHHRAIANWRAGHGLPAPERTFVLGSYSSVRSPCCRVSLAAGGAATSAGSPTRHYRTHSTRRLRRRPLDRWPVTHGFSAIFTGVNLCATIFYLRPGHDHVPHADLHLEHGWWTRS